MCHKGSSRAGVSFDRSPRAAALKSQKQTSATTS